MKDIVDRGIYGVSHGSLDTKTIFLQPPPPPVGYWVLHSGQYETRLTMHRRPSWITRWAMRVVFEITWRDT
jgi:hypothetical protein